MGLNFLFVKCAKSLNEISLGEGELNHFKVVYFKVIGKAQHLTRFEALVIVIRNLKASECSLGFVVPSYAFMSIGGLKSIGSGIHMI